MSAAVAKHLLCGVVCCAREQSGSQIRYVTDSSALSRGASQPQLLGLVRHRPVVCFCFVFVFFWIGIESTMRLLMAAAVLLVMFGALCDAQSDQPSMASDGAGNIVRARFARNPNHVETDSVDVTDNIARWDRNRS